MAVRRAAVAWVATLTVACGLLALPLVAFAATSPVNIQNSAFAPPTTTIKVGDTVTWTNRDAISHTSTSDTATWDTGVITAGASRSFTFMSAGTFAYHCSIHLFMHGTIVVQAASTPQPTPQPTAPPTPVRTTPPTAPPTAAPTEAATPSESPTPSPSPSASPVSATTETPTVSPPPSAVAVQLTPTPTASGGPPASLLIGAAALALLALGAIAVFLLRRS